MARLSDQAAARVCHLKPSYFLGLATEVDGNVAFVDENTVVYPIGHVLVYCDLQTENQRYLKVPETSKIITRIAVSPNRKFIAVVESGGKPTISIFNVENRVRVIILGNPFPHSSLDTFDHVSFTCDSEHLVAVTSDMSCSEPLVLYYKINGHVESHTPALGDLMIFGASITQIACNPTDRTILCIAGFGVFRFISWTDGQWIQYGFCAAGKLKITGVCWITDEMVLAGTKCGRLVAIEYGDIRGVYLANSVTRMHFVKGGVGEQRIDLQDGKIPKGYKHGIFQVNSLTSFPGGFAFSYTKANIVVFERIDFYTWVLKQVVYTVEPSKSTIRNAEVDNVHCIAVSPSGRQLACTTSRREVYIADITEKNFNELERSYCRKVMSGFHTGRVATIATCRWKPLLMSIGKDDGCCRLWNYQLKKLLFTQWFLDEKLYGCAFHPSGWYCLVGFKHQLKLFMVMVDELKSVRLFRIKMCSLMAFSREGHLFAALNYSRRTIEVYCCISFENLWVFKCYNNPVTALQFGFHDCYLYTTDPDGSVNFWDLQTGEDVNNKVYLDTPNYAVTSTKSGAVLFVGSDGALKEIRNETLHCYKLDQKPLNAIAIGEAETCLFVGGEKNSILSIEFPLSEPVLTIEFKMHSWPIKKLLIANNDSTLISLDDCGIVGVWRIKFPRDVQPPKFINVPELPEVVVNTRKLTEEDETIEKQQINIDRKLYQHNYILQHLQDAKEKDLESLKQFYHEQIEYNKKLIKAIEKMHSTHTSALQQAFDKMQYYYVSEQEKQSKDYESDLMLEYLKGDSIKGNIVVFVYDVRRFIKVAKAATKQIFELYDSFVNTKVSEMKAETVELRFKRKCLLQKFSRETYNFEKFINDLMERFKQYHERRLTKLKIRKEYLKDEILFLIKKSSSIDDKIKTFYGSGMRVFRHLDEIRADSRMLKTKIKALHLTLEAFEAQAKEKEDLIMSLRKAVKSDVQEQMEKTERLENIKFSLRTLMEKDLKRRRETVENLTKNLEKERAKFKSVRLCMAAVGKLNLEVLKKKDQTVANDIRLRKYLEEVKNDIIKANKVSDNRSELKNALLELYHTYINPFATFRSIGDNCDAGGFLSGRSFTGLNDMDKTGLEDVFEVHQMDEMLRKAEDSLRKEIAVMRKSLPFRPRLLVGHKYKTIPRHRLAIALRHINKYRYRLGEALQLLAAASRGGGCPCDDVPR